MLSEFFTKSETQKKFLLQVIISKTFGTRGRVSRLKILFLKAHQGSVLWRCLKSLRAFLPWNSMPTHFNGCWIFENYLTYLKSVFHRAHRLQAAIWQIVLRNVTKDILNDGTRSEIMPMTTPAPREIKCGTEHLQLIAFALSVKLLATTNYVRGKHSKSQLFCSVSCYLHTKSQISPSTQKIVP